MQKLLSPLLKVYGLFVISANFLQPIILLIFRLTWGYQFYISGQGKLEHPEKVIEFFTSLHIPLPEANAWFVSRLECYGGILLMLGLFSRPISLLLTGNMIVAYLSVDEDRAKVFGVFHDLQPFLSADPFFFLLTSVLVLAFGPGYLSLDFLLGKLVRRSLLNTKQ